jgi:hypothetical protein
VKKLLCISALTLLSAAASTPAQAAGFEVFGSYWNTSDIDDTFGGGLSFAVPLGSSGLDLQFRGTYYQELTDEPVGNLFDDDEGFFEEESLEVLPVDVGLRYNFSESGVFNPWIGGGGSYMFLDSTREGVDVDDETGFWVAVGSRFGDRNGTRFFAEALYRSTEATVRRDLPNDDDDIDDDVDIDLDGVAVNAGLIFSW